MKKACASLRTWECFPCNLVLFCSQITADTYFMSPPTALTPGSGELLYSLYYTRFTSSETLIKTRGTAVETGCQLQEASVCFAEQYLGYSFLFSPVSGYLASTTLPFATHIDVAHHDFFPNA